MTLYVCVDDKLGMAFMGRRQSRDRAVYEDIALRCGDAPLYMDARSQALFFRQAWCHLPMPMAASIFF